MLALFQSDFWAALRENPDPGLATGRIEASGRTDSTCLVVSSRAFIGLLISEGDQRRGWALECLSKIVDTGANPGERCAFCRGTMNVGTSVCARCGATRLVVGKGPLGFLCQLLLPLSMITTIIGLMWIALAGPTYGWFNQLALCGWAILILPPSLMVVLKHLGAENVKYFRSK